MMQNGFPVLGAVALVGAATFVQAQSSQPAMGTYPSKPVRLIVSSAPGGGQDVTTRPVAQKLSEALGVSVVVDNRGGASGIIAMDIARNAVPDGHTLLVGGTTMILMGVSGKISYDIRTAFEPVVQMTAQPYLVVLHPSVPIATPKELVAYARAKPGALTYGTSGPGSLHNLGMDLFQSITGTKLVHVPYKGSGPALIDLLAGQIQLMFTSTTSGAAPVKSGKLRAIAVMASDNYLGRRVASGMNVTGRLVVVVPWLSSNPFVWDKAIRWRAAQARTGALSTDAARATQGVLSIAPPGM